MKKCCFVGISSFLLLLFSISVAAQESTPAPAPAAKPADERLQLEKAEKDRPVSNGLNIEKKITGRLPNGYKNFVTNVQRDEIYKIQKEYIELVELLKLRIELLESEKNLRKKEAASKRATGAKSAE